MANGIGLLIQLPFFSAAIASKIGVFNLSPITSALNVIQAWGLKKGQQDSKRFETAYKLQPYFNAVNSAVSFWSFGYLVNELGKRYPLFNMNLTWAELGKMFTAKSWENVHPTWTSAAQFRFGSYGWGAMVIALTATTVAVTLLNKIYHSFYPKLTMEEFGAEDQARQKVLAKEVSISWDRPLRESFSQWIYVSQLCLNVALIFFSSSPIYFVLNAALNGYALSQVTQRKWLSVSRTREWKWGPGNLHVKSVEAVYRCFLMPIDPQKKQTEENCTVCLEGSPNTYFHKEHPFHEKCLIKFVVEKSEDFVTINSFKRNEKRDNQGHTTISYEGEMKNNAKPGCPNCREKPFYNDLEIYVNEHSRPFKADITWTD